MINRGALSWGMINPGKRYDQKEGYLYQIHGEGFNKPRRKANINPEKGMIIDKPWES